MPIDVYTREEIVTQSDEHVIPNFLGSALTCSDILDKNTNDRFGCGIDSALSKALRPFLVLADGRPDRRRNAPPGPLKGIPGHDGKRYDVEAGGIVHVQPSITIDALGCSARIRGTGPNERVIRRRLGAWAKRKGYDLCAIDKQVSQMLTRTTARPPQLVFELPLFQTDCYRAIAKIACNFLAYHSPQLFLCPEFDSIRGWVLADKCEAQSPVELTLLDGDTAGFSSLDHWVRVATTDSHRVEGAVVLFGTMAFNVDLGPAPKGGVIARALRVDQFGRRHRIDHQDDLCLSLESLQAARARSFEDFYALALLQTNTLVAKILGKQREHWIDRTIREIVDEVGGQGDEPFTVEQAHSFARLFVPRIVAGLLPNAVQADEGRIIDFQAQRDGDTEGESVKRAATTLMGSACSLPADQTVTSSTIPDGVRRRF